MPVRVPGGVGRGVNIGHGGDELAVCWLRMLRGLLYGFQRSGGNDGTYEGPEDRSV